MSFSNNINEQDDLKDMLAKCYADPRVLARLLFPETYSRPFSKLHDQIFEAIAAGEKKIVISAARSFGKTSIARLLAMHSILFRDARFICYVGLSATFAEMQTENIKMELQASRDVRTLFGDVSSNYYSLDGGKDMQFSKKAWIANGYTMVLPRGSGQQIRGLNWVRYRPDLFIIDDLEDTETIDNSEIRKKRKEWFHADLMKAKAIDGDPRFIYIDTIKHYDALIIDLLDSPQWCHITLPICDKSYHTMAPEFKSQKELDEELEEARRLHMMDMFYREYMCEPIAGEERAFKQEYFQYYTEDDVEFINQLHQCITVVIVDPAKTVKPDSAQSGYSVWSVNMKTNRMYLRYSDGSFLHADEIVNRGFDLAEEYSADAIGWEETSLNEFIKHPVMNEAARRGINTEIIWLNPRRDKREDISGDAAGKAARVGSLISYYRRGLVYHNRANCGQIETQLLSFPKPKRWDVMDSACYIVQIMQEGSLFMDWTEEPDSPDDAIYERIEHEAALVNWRTV